MLIRAAGKTHGAKHGSTLSTYTHSLMTYKRRFVEGKAADAWGRSSRGKKLWLQSHDMEIASKQTHIANKLMTTTTALIRKSSFCFLALWTNEPMALHTSSECV